MDDAQKLISRIIDLAREDRVAEARSLLEEALSGAPEMVARWYILGKLLTAGEGPRERQIEGRLKEYGAAPEKAFRGALDALTQAQAQETGSESSPAAPNAEPAEPAEPVQPIGPVTVAGEMAGQALFASEAEAAVNRLEGFLGQVAVRRAPEAAAEGLERFLGRLRLYDLNRAGAASPPEGKPEMASGREPEPVGPDAPGSDSGREVDFSAEPGEMRAVTPDGLTGQEDEPASEAGEEDEPASGAGEEDEPASEAAVLERLMAFQAALNRVDS